MSKKIKVDQLTKEIEKALTEFVGVTEEACDKGVRETAKNAVQALRNAHPSGSGQYGSWDKYNSGWKVMQTKTDKRYHRKATIHNETDYQLTHLLEKGHALANGGRARAFPHIAPVAEQCETDLLKNIKKHI
ncbi:MAG: hypothetical protein K5870_00980 [Lachnospiraceae bacterium]|nr:hypothetical protein [Lachnospiraceae bacterium]